MLAYSSSPHEVALPSLATHIAKGIWHMSDFLADYAIIGAASWTYLLDGHSLTAELLLSLPLVPPGRRTIPWPAQDAGLIP